MRAPLFNNADNVAHSRRRWWWRCWLAASAKRAHSGIPSIILGRRINGGGTFCRYLLIAAVQRELAALATDGEAH